MCSIIIIRNFHFTTILNSLILREPIVVMSHLVTFLIFTLPIHVETENIAFGKPAFQSSNFNARWTADKALDGNLDPEIHKNGCTHTGRKEWNPWWKTDLLQRYNISKVTLYNRVECCRQNKVCINRGARGSL